jgi:hypothetical protein
MAAFSLAEPLLSGGGGIPIEWILLIGWAFLGGLVYAALGRASAHPIEG